MLISMYLAGTIGYGFTAFIEPIADELGWSYTKITLGSSLRGLEGGLMAPLFGMLVDRWGPRRLMFIGSIILTLGLLLLSRTTSLLMYYTAFSVIAVGVSCCSMTSLMTTVANWFRRRIGIAIGIASCGFGLSGLMIPVIVRLTDSYGWRTALTILALGVLCLITPLSLLFRHKPEQYGYLPDGDDPGATMVDKGHMDQAVLPIEESIGVRQALRSRVFWHIALAYVCFHLSTGAVVTHVMPYLGSIGIARTTAGMIAMAIPLGSVVGRLGMGWIADRVDRRRVSMIAFTMMCLGLVCFEFTDTVSTWLLVPFLLLFCIGYGGNNTMRAALLRGMFGRENFGSIFGFLMGVSVSGAVMGPPLAGWVFDNWGSYQNVWLVAACFSIVAMLLIWTMPNKVETRE